MTSVAVQIAPVPATIAPTTAEGVAWHVVVVGAGPAGASTAAWLASRGLRTLLVDRHAMPRGKVCGCCLSPAAAAELRGLAGTPMAAAIEELPIAPLNTVRLVNRGRTAILPLSSGGVVSREALDTALVRGAVAAGCDWLPECQVTMIDESSSDEGTVGVSLTAAGKPSGSRACLLRAAYVVVATGLSDRVRIGSAGHSGRGDRIIDAQSRIGIGAAVPPSAIDLPPGQLVMAIGREGYCGLVRLDDGRVDIAAAIDRVAVARHGTPAGAVIELVVGTAAGAVDSDAFAAAVCSTTVQATPPLTRTASLVAGVSGRILRVGDAAGYVEPFTGEGIGWALAGGRMLAEVLAPRRQERQIDVADPAQVAAFYRDAHGRHFAPHHRRCGRVASLLRQPVAVAAAVTAAQVMPSVAGRLVPAVIGAGATSR